MQFDGKLEIEFRGATITSDAGLLPFREMDEAFRLTEKGSTVLSDPRNGKSTEHSMLATLRQGVYARLTGCEYVNDAERGQSVGDGDVEFEAEPDGAAETVALRRFRGRRSAVVTMERSNR